MAHPVAVAVALQNHNHNGTIQSTQRSRRTTPLPLPLWTTSRLSALLLLTLAFVLLAPQPAHCAPAVASAAVGAPAAAAHSAGRSGESSPPLGSAQAASILGESPEDREFQNRHSNGPYHQRGSRKARSAQHRCNTTLAQYGQDLYLEVKPNGARTVGADPSGTKKPAKRRPRHSRGANRFFFLTV